MFRQLLVPSWNKVLLCFNYWNFYFFYFTIVSEHNDDGQHKCYSDYFVTRGMRGPCCGEGSRITTGVIKFCHNDNYTSSVYSQIKTK